jgi:hypothetical protein
MFWKEHLWNFTVLQRVYTFPFVSQLLPGFSLLRLFLLTFQNFRKFYISTYKSPRVYLRWFQLNS